MDYDMKTPLNVLKIALSECNVFLCRDDRLSTNIRLPTFIQYIVTYDKLTEMKNTKELMQ